MARYPYKYGTLGEAHLITPLKISQFFFPIYATINLYFIYYITNLLLLFFIISIISIHSIILHYLNISIIFALLYLLYYIHSIILNTLYFYIVMKPIISYWMCIYFLISLFLVVWLIDFIVNIGYFRYIKFDRII